MFKNYPLQKYTFGDKYRLRTIRNYYYYSPFFIQYIKQLKPSLKEKILSDYLTPEELSARMYGSNRYWFLLLMINEIIDPFFDWVLSNDSLIEYAKKYVTENYLDVQNYVSANPKILEEFNKEHGTNYTAYTPKDPTDINDPLVYTLFGVYYTILEKENQKRRKIFVPDPNLMNEIYNAYLRITSDYR